MVANDIVDDSLMRCERTETLQQDFEPTVDSEAKAVLDKVAVSVMIGKD